MVMSISGPLGVLYYLDSIGISFLDADERRLFPNSPEAVPIPSGRGGYRHSELGRKISNIKS